MENYSRRQFLASSSKLAAGAGLASLPVVDALADNPRKKTAANDKVQIALIGCNGMGWSNLTSHMKLPEVEVVGLCDVDNNVLTRRSAELEKTTGKKVTQYKDFRKLLENKDVDAVIIATPDHWHCLTMVNACEAGKDVYVEKPLANSVEECQVMMDAAKKYNKVVQVGQWQRSGPHWQKAIDYVQSGKLGKIRLVKSWAYMGWMKEIQPKPDGPAPAGVDYDMWLGPAEKRPFNPNRFHFNFRWYWDYAGGLMTDWGVHLIDMVLYGMKAAGPKSVVSMGGKFAYPTGAMETPDTQQAIYEFDDFSMIWEHAVGINIGPYNRDHGVAFIGNLGTLVVDRGKWEVFPEVENNEYKTAAIPVQSRGGADGGLDSHTKNFIECIKTRQKPNCDVWTAANTAINAHLGNIAFKTGRKVYWDAGKQQFKDDAKANELLKANYHNGWKLPLMS
jgi:predicted dehydrogenase